MEPAQITVNGEERALVPAGPHTNLLDWLRAQGLTGAKEGCAEGECGACAVLVARPDDAAEGADGGTLGAGMQGGGPVQHAGGNQYDGGTHLDHGSQHDDGAHHGDGTHHEGDTRHGDGAQAGAAPVTAGRSRWTAINACLPPALALDGQEILTAEGLGTAPGACATGDLHPVQQEMARRGGSQCGYCTPGFICAMAAEYYRPGRLAQTDGVHAPGTDTGSVGRNGFDLHALSGNLCRCTGYRPIRDAAYALTGPAPEDPLALRHHRPAAPARNTTWVTGGAQFIRPASLTELLERYGQEPGATLLAGATDLGVDINLRHVRPSAVLAIDHLPELRTWEVTDHRIEIGAALTLSEIERTLSGRVPLLAELLPQFASPLIRNTATLGGNIATASPIGDAAPVLLALDASLVLVSAAGEREVRLADYFTGYRRTVRHPVR